MEMIGVGRLRPAREHRRDGAQHRRGVAVRRTRRSTASSARARSTTSPIRMAFMREAARITRPDGRVVIALANFESVSCKLGRASDRLMRRLRRPRPAWRPYWEMPEDHNVKGDLPYVRSLGGDWLVLDRCTGISLLWLFSRYGALLDRLPERMATRDLERARPHRARAAAALRHDHLGLAKAGCAAMADALNQDYDVHIAVHVRADPGRRRRGRIASRARGAGSRSPSPRAGWRPGSTARSAVCSRARRVLSSRSLCDAVSRSLFHVSIGDRVEIGPGLMMTHGNVVIDGRTRIGTQLPDQSLGDDRAVEQQEARVQPRRPDDRRRRAHRHRREGARPDHHRRPRAHRRQRRRRARCAAERHGCRRTGSRRRRTTDCRSSTSGDPSGRDERSRRAHAPGDRRLQAPPAVAEVAGRHLAGFVRDRLGRTARVRRCASRTI